MSTVAEILKGQGETPICRNHLQQQLTFIRGSGVEFLPRVDENGIRKAFLDGVVKANRLKTRVKRLALRMMTEGRILLYLRPAGKTYRILDYVPDQYRVYRDKAGELEEVRIIYCYKFKDENSGNFPRDRWVRLRIKNDIIETLELDTRPDFEMDYSTASNVVIPKLTENQLGFIPCREVLNPAPATDEEGVSDFEALQGQIEAHDDMVTSIIDNLYFFANSPIVSSREAEELTEAMGITSGINRDSVAEISGFRDISSAPPKRRSRRDRIRKLKKVVGGFEPDEMIQQLNINAIPSDHVLFASQYEQQIRESLGGVLERGIETATETNTVYGKVAATAAEKQEALFTYGICELLELAILAEEALHVATEGKEGLYSVNLDRTVTWRVGEVYRQSPEALNYRSITARNLTKFFGVSPRAAIQYVFPEKSDAEISQMVSSGGFPSDYLSTAIGMFAQLAGTIDPLTGMPVADLGGVPLAYRLLPFIEQNLNYGSQFSTNPPDTRTSESTIARALNGALAYLQRQRAAEAAGAGMGGVGTVSTGQSDEPIPEPGSVVSAPSNGGFWRANFPTFAAVGDAVGAAGAAIGRAVGFRSAG